MALYFVTRNRESYASKPRFVSARGRGRPARGNAVYPGGGGQLPTRASSDRAAADRVTGFEVQDRKLWHLLASAIRGDSGGCRGGGGSRFVSSCVKLRTDLHIVSALVYQGFNGALVTEVFR